MDIDPSTITAWTTTATTLIDALERLKKAVKSKDWTAAEVVIQAIHADLSRLTISGAAMRDRIHELEMQLAEAKRQSDQTEQMEFVESENAFFRINGDSREGPYCPGCWANGKMSRAIDRGSHHMCLVCDKYWHRVSDQPRSPGRAITGGDDWDYNPGGSSRV